MRRAAPRHATRHGAHGGVREQKWSKGKVHDKLNNMVLFDEETYAKLMKDVPSYKLITPSIISERFKVRGSLARRVIKELHQADIIRPVATHHAQTIYTRAPSKAKE